MTSGLSVEYREGRSGVAPLTWGQRAIWGALEDLGPDRYLFNIGWEVADEDGWLLPTVERAVHELLDLHESFRTRLCPTGSGLEQVLDGAGRLEVSVCALDDGGTAFGQLAADLLAAPFDCAGEWPLRVAVGCRGGLAKRVSFVASHHALDGEAVPIVRADAARLLAGESARDILAQRTVLQPLDLAAHEASPAGQRSHARSRGYWERKLNTIPATMFPPEVRQRLADPREPRFWQARLTSRALLLSADDLAARWQTSSTAIIMAGLARAISRITGTPYLTLQVMASNRVMPALRMAVSSLTQEGLFAVEVGDDSFDALVQRVWKASLVAYKHAAYDKVDVNELVNRIGRERGTPFDRSCWFNDMRAPTTDAPAAANVESITSALSETTLTWPAKFERQGDVTFSLHIHDVPHTMTLVLTADTHVMGPAVIESTLRAMETAIVGASLSCLVPA